MGTHARIHVDGDEGRICTIYQHFDGYPDNILPKLHSLLEGLMITAGVQPGHTANGMNCLAAMVVQLLKDGPGNVYLYPPNGGPEAPYTYIITEVDGYPHITVEGDTNEIYSRSQPSNSKF